MQRRIAVDLDGVLANTIVPVCTTLNRRRSTPLTPESFNQWNAWKVAGVTKDQFFRALDEAWFLWKQIPPTEDNLAEKLEPLWEFGIVDIVTGRSPSTVTASKNWLKSHGIRYNSFVRTANSTDGKTSLDYDIYIDDNAELMALLAPRPETTGILYLQPWNKNSAPMPRIYRVGEWREVPAIISRINDRIK